MLKTHASNIVCHCVFAIAIDATQPMYPSIYLSVYLSIFFCLGWWWGNSSKVGNGDLVQSWYLKFCIALHFNKLTLSEKYCLFFECILYKTLSSSVIDVPDDRKWMNQCVCFVVVVLMAYVLKSEQYAPLLPTPQYHDLITEIIAANSMFKPDLKNNTQTRHFLRLFWCRCCGCSVRLNGQNLSAIIHARALCVWVSTLCACTDFTALFYHPYQICSAMAERARSTQVK